jgi:hypothetical protein
VIAVQYRPFWFKLFDPRLTGGLIAVIIFLFFIALSNVFSLFGALSAGNMPEAGQRLLSILLYTIPAFGLLKLKRWARLFEIAFSLLIVVLGLFLMIYANMFMGMIIVVSHGLVGICLLSAKTRAVFYPPQPEEASE